MCANKLSASESKAIIRVHQRHPRLNLKQFLYIFVHNLT